MKEEEGRRRRELTFHSLQIPFKIPINPLIYDCIKTKRPNFFVGKRIVDLVRELNFIKKSNRRLLFDVHEICENFAKKLSPKLTRFVLQFVELISLFKQRHVN